MAIFTAEQQTPATPIFKVPSGAGITFPKAQVTTNKERVLYPVVSGLSKEEVDAYIDSSITGPLNAQVDNRTREKDLERVQTIVNEQPDMPFAIDELEAARNDNPILKTLISPATLAALRQSDNQVARRAAQNKLANVLMAVELMQAKSEEASSLGYDPIIPGPLELISEDFAAGVNDFVQSAISGLPILSNIDTEKRRELSNRFVVALESNDSPEVIKQELQNILNEAADQGLLSSKNQFYLGDFIALVSEGSTGVEAATQQAFSSLDTVIGMAGTLGDAGRLLAFTRRGKDVVKETLIDAVKQDNPVSGHTMPQNFDPSIISYSPLKAMERSPDEATAALEANLTIKAMDEAMRVRMAAGTPFDPEAFEVFKAGKIKSAIEAAERQGLKSFVDADVTVDNMNNVYLIETFGTTKGRAFTSEKKAQQFAVKLGKDAVVTSARDGSGFIVKKVSNLPTGLLSAENTPNKVFDDLQAYRTTDVDELKEGFFAKWAFSPLSQTTAYNNAILKQGESARALLNTVINKNITPALRKAGTEGRKAVDKVLLDIRDGARASDRAWPMGADFEKLFVEKNGRIPTQAEIDLYNTSVHWSDVQWFFEADTHLKREVNKGVEILVTDTIEVASVKASKETFAGAKAWDIDQGKYVDVDTLKEEYQLFKVAEPVEFGGKLHDLVATRTPNTRRLRHSDVLGYNPGGSRWYENNINNFIIKQDKEVTLADGRTVPVRPVAIMAGKTQREIIEARDEINAIIDELHNAVNPRGTKLNTADTPVKTGDFAFTREEFHRTLLAKANSKELNDFIADKSKWNVNVQDVKTLVEFADDMGIDLRKGVVFVEDGEPIVRGDMFLGDITMKDSLVSAGNLKRGGVRKDSVMKGVGGMPQATMSPLETIQSSVMGTLSRNTQIAYEQAAVQGLVKGLIKGVAGKPLVDAKTLGEIRFMPGIQKLRALEGKIMTGTEEGKKLELERQKILYRLEGQNFLDAGIMKAKDRLSNALYDKGWNRTSKAIDSFSVEPISAIRGITFDAYLGMGAPDQLWVQASQIPTIVALADQGVGWKAVAALPYIRGILANGHPAPTSLMAAKMSKMLGMTPEQFITMVDEFKKSGKYSVENVADMSDSGYGQMAFQRVREAGRVFYNEGERLARITAHVSATMQAVGKFDDITSVAARRYIAHHSDVFTNAMTSVSRTKIEQLPMMQFMSYSMRMAEYMFGGLNKDIGNLMKGGKWTDTFGAISLKQKTRLAVMQLGLYGAAAVPFVGPQLDYFNYKYGKSEDQTFVQTIRTGVLDGLINYITGIETEVGRRLAWGEGVWSTMQDFSSKSLPEVALGPSYNLASDVITGMSRFVGNIMTGGTEAAPEDFLDILRSIKSVNLGYNSIMATKYGMYRTKTGTVVSDEIEPGEAAAIAMGIPITKVNEVWRLKEMMKQDKQYYQDRANKINEIMSDLAVEYKTNGFYTEYAKERRKQVEVLLALESPFDRNEIMKRIDQRQMTLQMDTIMDLQKTNSAAREEVLK